MPLQDCPNEIIHRILYFSVLTRGLRRALRLKLVCKFFYDALQPALFESRLLDNVASDCWCGIDVAFERYNSRKSEDNGADRLWHDYVVVRVNTDSNPAASRFGQVRHVAEKLAGETGQDLRQIILDLCWFAQGSWFEPSLSPERPEGPPDPDIDLLSVATYFGYLPLVQKLLLGNSDFRDDRNLFPSPMYMAAYTGNKQLLLLFQERVPEFLAQDSSTSGEWTGKISPGAMLGAAKLGDMDVLQFVMNPLSITTEDFLKRHDSDHYRLRGTAESCLPPTVEVLEYLKSALGGFEGKFYLYRYASIGHTDIVRYYLDNGADVQGWLTQGGSLLSQAARHFNWDVVDLLLDRGVDMRFWAPLQDIVKTTSARDRRLNSSAIVAAAQGGSLAMMRHLFDRGAVLEYPRSRRSKFLLFAGHLALSRAVELEHTAMIEFLLEKGAGDLFRPFFRRDLRCREERKWPLTKALKLGLESMVDVLRRNGITRESLDKDRWIIWHFD